MPDEIADAIAGAWSEPQVAKIAERTYAVRVPTHRMEHDVLSIIVEELDAASGGGRHWRMSDDGYVGFLLDGDLEQLTEVLDSPLAWAQFEGSELIAMSTDDALATAVLAFARQIDDLTVAARTVDVMRAAQRARRVADSSARVIAREMKSQLARAAPRINDLIRLNRRLALGHGITVRAPLAVNQPRGDVAPPALVASAVDLTGSSVSVRSGLGTTSLVLDMAERLDIERRFLIVRGDTGDQGSDLHELYDRKGVVVVATDAPDALLDTVRELERELVAAMG